MLLNVLQAGMIEEMRQYEKQFCTFLKTTPGEYKMTVLVIFKQPLDQRMTLITTPGSENVWRPEAIDPHTQQVTLSNRWLFAQPDPRLSLYANAYLLTFSRTRTLGCLHSFYTMLHHSNRWGICPDRDDLAPGLALCEQKDYGCLP